MSDFDITAFHPVIDEWFTHKFGQPTDVQRQAWASLAAGEHTLIAAPTGSGKTLAALLPCVNRIVTDKEREAAVADATSPLADRTSGTGGSGSESRTPGVRLLYITPLKALNNDIHHHVIGFAEEMAETAAASGRVWPGLRIGVRTGDTPQSTRASMLRQPPDVLITTPESFYIMLTSPKGRDILRTVEQIVIDEIHDLAADKRGLHLSVTLERLVEWCWRSPQRIGVSATIRPLETVARYLGGWEVGSESAADSGEERETSDRDQDSLAPAVTATVSVPQDCRPRPVRIIESAMRKTFELFVTMPDQTVIAQTKEAAWTPLISRLMQLMEGSRTVIVFVNTRRLSERLTQRLNDHAGYELARAHHGSVAREKRLEVERALKAGELRCLVATASMELGIDVGHVDLVIQIDSPQSAAAGIQRIGRAGHAVGDASRGVIVARSRGVLPECALLARHVAERTLEDIRIPQDDLGVLCQQTVAMVATDDWQLGRVHRVLARAYGYRGLTRERLAAAVQALAGFYPFARPLLDWDRETGLLHRRSVTPMAAIMGSGTIPQSSAYPVHHADSRLHLGELDETYVHESRVGDVFQLGTSSWMIQSIQADRIYVKETANTFSEIPFWLAEAPGRSFTLSTRVGQFMADIERRLEAGGAETANAGTSTARKGDADAADWLTSGYFMDGPSAEQLIALIRSQRAAGALPTDRRIVFEHFQDETEQHHLIVHSWFGRRLNRTWQLALQRYWEERLPFRFYTHSKDNGIEFVFPEWDAERIPGLMNVGAHNAEQLLREAIPSSPLFGAAFRRLADTSLLLPRSYTRMPAARKRLLSERLLRDAMPFAEQFPFIGEAIRICLDEHLDLPGLQDVLNGLQNGHIEADIRHVSFPSPFAVQFVADYVNTQLYESDAIGKDLQLQLLSLNKELAGEWFGNDALRGMLEPVVSAMSEDGGIWPERRLAQRPDDVLRLLKQRGDMTREELMLRLTSESSGQTTNDGQPASFSTTDRNQKETHAISGETAAAFVEELQRRRKIAVTRVGGEERLIAADESETYARFPEDPHALTFVLKRYVDGQLYITPEQLAVQYGLPKEQAEHIVNEWAEQRMIAPSPFSEPGESSHWTSQSILSRLIRLSLRHFRGQAEPADPIRYCEELLKLQYVRSDCRLSGQDGLRSVIARLQGLFLPLPFWESAIFPSRLTDYRKETLDLLCASGEIVWIGRKEDGEKEGKIAFFLVESKELIAPFLKPVEAASGDASAPSELYALLRHKGASFLSAISRETGRPPSELMPELLKLVWEGLVSNDQFAPLRMHGGSGSKSPKAGNKFQSGLGRWYTIESLRDGTVSPESAVTSWMHHLLAANGLITKDMMTERLPYPWERLQGALRQLEEWGMLTRGLWVRDIPALQFSTKELVERLRQPDWAKDEGMTLLSSLDPANPFGLTVKWPERDGIAFARKSGNYLVLQGGRWLYWIENNGRRFYTIDDTALRPETIAAGRADDSRTDSGDEARLTERYAALRPIAKSLLQLPGMRKIVIDSWNGERIQLTAAASFFEQLGAEKDGASFVLWPSSFK
ncbi:DEAD/DEAH box helicase [Paenibacillus sp. MBLB4367]|uniref:DEAD/DEAH box helicase n=1 Tax=Paenibacillus sp. MBLB4367 TaxID=3384767 RepID=UPI0039082B56